MTLLVPVMLFSWVPITIMFFLILRPQTAVVCSVIGGILFLPMATYDLQAIPEYSKVTAIAIGLVIGGSVAGKSHRADFHWQIYDLPMAIWCFFCPVASSMSNGLGLYDGLSGTLENIAHWGVFYWTGRLYFRECSSLRDLSLGIVIGGLIYIPLCLYEFRMSPQLSNIFYGFFPHSFAQHYRYGGYRPIVFMQHGLMVAFWMAQASIISFWLWRSKIISHLKGIPIGLIAISLTAITIFCKSANGWFFLFIGIASYFLFKSPKLVRFSRFILLLIPLYWFCRCTQIISYENLQAVAELVFDTDRVRSLSIRLLQEDLFSLKAWDRPILGWGGWHRGWPLNPQTGELVDLPVDSLWIITFSTRGFVGLVNLYLAMLIGPWFIFSRYGIGEKHDNEKEMTFHVDAIVIGLAIVFFMIDSLMNGMINPVFIVCSGALISYHIASKHNSNVV